MIHVGSPVPHVFFDIMTPDGPCRVTSKDVFAGKSVLVFAMPGAFTPYCHALDLPSILSEYEIFKAGGVDIVACTSVNDVYVLDAWAEASGAKDRILFLADGNGDFARSLNLLSDYRPAKMGFRSKRYAMWAEDGVIRDIAIKRASNDSDMTSADVINRIFDDEMELRAY